MSAQSLPLQEQKYVKLRRFNLVMGFLHLIQGIFHDLGQ